MVEDYFNRKTANAKQAILQKAIKHSGVLHFLLNFYFRHSFAEWSIPRIGIFSKFYRCYSWKIQKSRSQFIFHFIGIYPPAQYRHITVTTAFITAAARGKPLLFNQPVNIVNHFKMFFIIKKRSKAYLEIKSDFFELFFMQFFT